MDSRFTQPDFVVVRRVEGTRTPLFRSAAAIPIHHAADSHVRRLSVALRYAFAMGRKVLHRNRTDIEGAVSAVGSALEKVLPAMLRSVMESGGSVGSLAMRRMHRAAQDAGIDRRELGLRVAADPIKFKFNSSSKEAIEWSKEHAAELVTEITETTRKRLNTALSDLTEEGDWELATDRLNAALGDEDRAELIARHETMLAASEGQRMAWDQAVEDGLLTGNEKRTWIVTPDDKLCPICEELDGAIADLDGEYPGGFEGPPAHVQCRCTEGLI